MLTKTELEEIAKRAEAASSGPWRSLKYGTPSEGPTFFWTCAEDKPDLEFIAHARTDIPRLLEHIAKLEVSIERILALSKEHEGYAESNPNP